MKVAWPAFERVTWSHNKIRWRGSLCPTTMSATYTVHIDYSLELSQPEVRVVEPALRNRGDVPPPHVYREGFLCLFFTPADEWTHSMFIARTTIPWTATWLYFYEMWHATGEWLGGGEHPRGRDSLR